MYENRMELYEKCMKLYEKCMKLYEKCMKLYEKNLKVMHKLFYNSVELLMKIETTFDGFDFCHCFLSYFVDLVR